MSTFKEPPNEKTPDASDLARTSSFGAGDSETAGVVDLSRTETKRGIKSRHAQMIAIGGTIGTGLFVGAGQALAAAGPGNLFLAYSLICFFVYGIMTGVAEVATYMPVPGRPWRTTARGS